MIAKLLSWWKDKIKPLEVTGLIVLLVGFFTLIIVIIIGYIFNWDWTGLGPYSPPHPYESSFQRGKTLWDWLQLLIIPVVLAIAGYLFNRVTSRNEQNISLDNQRESALQQYIDNMSYLLLEKGLSNTQVKDEVRNIARTRTLTVLPRLDAYRKGSVLQFIHESGLIRENNPVINLAHADLSGADLSHLILDDAHLTSVNLSNAILRGTRLYYAKLDDSDLSNADLSYSHLTDISLIRANLSNANLRGADLSSADLRHTDLKGSNLSHTNFTVVSLEGAELDNANLSNADCASFVQIEKARSLTGTIMPDGNVHP